MTGHGPRMLVTGANGFVGGRLVRRAAAEFDVFCAGRRPPSSAAHGEHVEMDLTQDKSVQSVFDRVRPEIVVHLAAVSDIDQCEQQQDLAEAVNVLGTDCVARECARTGARMVFASSAAIFDGTRHGYREDDPPTPVSFYGECKARAEAAVARVLPSALILRLSLVLGFATRPGTNALLNKLAESFRAGRPVAVPTYEYRNPLDAATLAEFILELARFKDACGIFHLGSRDSLSRFELVARLAEKMGYTRSLVQPQSEPIPGRAPRGLDHFLRTDKIAMVCRTPIPSCEEVIERAVHATA